MRVQDASHVEEVLRHCSVDDLPCAALLLHLPEPMPCMFTFMSESFLICHPLGSHCSKVGQQSVMQAVRGADKCLACFADAYGRVVTAGPAAADAA